MTTNPVTPPPAATAEPAKTFFGRRPNNGF
jgi:hypothetical protein